MQNDKIKVSICVPIYGAEKYIAATARSLFAQSYDNIEYIFVNDCTKDRSIEILKDVVNEYPHRQSQTRIIDNPHNSGLSATRHNAVLQATGDYIFHFDDDDILLPDAIALYAQKAEETDADMVMADHNYVYLDHTTPHCDVVPQDKKEYVKRLLTRRSTIEIWGRLIRRSFILEHNLFAPDGLDLSEDFVLVPKMAYLAKRVAKVDAPLINYLRYAGSGSTVVRRKGLETTGKAMQLLEDFFTQIPDAADYAETLKEARLHNKVTLYGIAAKADYPYVRALYNDTPVWSSGISLTKKCLLTLAGWHLDSLVFRIIHHFTR